MVSKRSKRAIPPKQASEGDSGAPTADVGLVRSDGGETVLDARSYDPYVGEAQDWPMCRLCLLPLMMKAERLVGVHIGCIHRQESLRPVLRSASYGTRR